MSNTHNIADAGSSKAQVVWIAVLAVTIVAFAANLFIIFRDSGYDDVWLDQTVALRAQAQRAEASARRALGGDANAFDELGSARQAFTSSLGNLVNGAGDTPAPGDVLGAEISSLTRTWGVSDKAIATLIERRASVERVSEAASAARDVLPDLQARLDSAIESLLTARAPADQVGRVQRLAMMAERVSANLERILQGADSAAADQLASDAAWFEQTLTQLQDGVVKDPAALASLANAQSLFADVGQRVAEVGAAAAEVLEANAAETALLDNAEALGGAISATAEKIGDAAGERPIGIGSAGALGALMLVALLMTALQSSISARRRLEASNQASERNQQAILRLLDELAGLADGDLTTTATVTEDFTGAIADAINFTIDQLRVLVSSINETSKSVSGAAEDAQATALHLAEAAEHQAQEITGASAAISEMAMSIDQVSSNAAESATVAERSVELANSGSQVVQNTIGGMDTIREQIQDTSKRIKRLGESSQEIGDIVSLINDIADQTNILALNAAIQASMAGDAGRGFAVVADEVQRLAERSGGATRQIEALVKTIQSDTHEAVSSMEQTTAEVVRGAKLAEDAGVALEEIDSTSRSLAELIQNISNAARQQASSAGHISNTMNIIQEITSQTSAGTTATAQSIGKLAGITNELRNSVDGFKLPGDERR